MTQIFNTPQEAEDAYYDALEESNLDKLLSIWADSEDICCLLPMYPMILGRKGVEEAYTHLLSQGQGVELSIAHLNWIETNGMAIHLVEEQLPDPSTDATPPPPPLYATNIFRKEDTGWRLIVHQNAPTPPPPPPELVMPD